MPRPSGAVRRRSPTSNAGSPKKTSPPSASSCETLRSRTPAVATGDASELLELGLAGAGEVAERGAQVLEVDQRQALLRRSSGRSAPRLDSCVSLSDSTLESSVGPNSVTVARTATPSWPVSDSSSTGQPAGVHSVGELGGPGGDAVVGRARRADARQVALHVGGEDGAAGGRDLLRDELERAGLAGSGRARDEPVAVEEAERDAPPRRRCRAPPDRRRGAPGGRSGRVNAVPRGHVLVEAHQALVVRTRGTLQGAQRAEPGDPIVGPGAKVDPPDGPHTHRA